MKRLSIICVSIALMTAMFTSTVSACELARWIAGRCYVQDTGDALIGVKVTVTDVTAGISVEAQTGVFIINGTVYQQDDTCIQTPDGLYIVNFACNIWDLFREIWPCIDGHFFNIDAEAIFEDNNGKTYQKITPQYENVEIICGDIFLANFEYEIQTAALYANVLAVPGDRSVTLQWETSDESDVLGFNVYRSENGSQFIKVNDQLIYAEGGSGIGSDYEFIDEDVINRTAYTYVVEDIDTFGQTAFTTPVDTMPRFIYDFIPWEILNEIFRQLNF